MPSTARVGAVVMVAGFVYVLASRASNVGCLLGVALMLGGALAVAISTDRRELPGQRAPQKGDESRQRDTVVRARGSLGERNREPSSVDGQVGASAEDQVSASADG